MPRQSDEEMGIGGAHDARVHTYEPDRVWLTLVEHPGQGHGLAWSGEMTPAEARALAALLLKHADRAEERERDVQHAEETLARLRARGALVIAAAEGDEG